MCTHKVLTPRDLFLVFILPLALLTVPDLARAHHEQLAQATVSPEMPEVAEVPKSEGSKSKSYSHGSKHGCNFYFCCPGLWLQWSRVQIPSLTPYF